MIRLSPLAVPIAKARKSLGGSVVDTFTLNKVYMIAVTEMSESHRPEESARRLFEWNCAMGHVHLLKLEKDLRLRFGDSLDEIPFEVTADLYKRVFGRIPGGGEAR